MSNMWELPAFAVIMPCCGEIELMTDVSAPDDWKNSTLIMEGNHGPKISLRLTVTIISDDGEDAVRKLRFNKGRQGQASENVDRPGKSSEGYRQLSLPGL